MDIFLLWFIHVHWKRLSCVVYEMDRSSGELLLQHEVEYALLKQFLGLDVVEKITLKTKVCKLTFPYIISM